MSWSYSNDPSSSPKDEVRYILGDTNPSMPLLQDEEIQYELKLQDNNAKNAALAAGKKALAKLSLEISVEVGPFKQKMENRFNHYKLIVDKLEKDKLKGNAYPIGGPTTPGPFALGMHDIH